MFTNTEDRATLRSDLSADIGDVKIAWYFPFPEQYWAMLLYG
jgi:hypothetical protein